MAKYRAFLWAFWPEITKNPLKNHLQTSSFWRVFDPFRVRSDVHVFEVDFQYSQICHIYRASGKSKLRFIFISIPYEGDPKIGGRDGVFDPEITDLAGKVSPWGQKVPFSWFLAIFWQNWRISRAERVVLAGPVKTAKISHFMPFWPFWAILADYGLKRASFWRVWLKIAKKSSKTLKIVIFWQFLTGFTMDFE